MKPFSEKRRQRDWISLSNFAMFDLGGTIQQPIHVRDHMFPYHGARENPDFLWGVYGTTSTNQSMFLADAWAARHKKRAFMLTMWYQLAGFHEVSTRGGETIEESSFLLMGRLKVKLRDIILEMFDQWLRDEYGNQASYYTDLRWEDLLMRVPHYIPKIFDEYPNLKMIMHPVRQIYDESYDDLIQIATVRNDPALVMAAEVRYKPDFEVEI